MTLREAVVGGWFLGIVTFALWLWLVQAVLP
jgi:hypothetical protein